MPLIIYRICTKCSNTLNIAEFGKDKHQPDGLNTRCRQCVKIANYNYRTNNPTKFKQSAKNHYESNKSTVNKKAAQYGRAEHRREQKKQYYENNKDWLNEKSRNWHKVNWERTRGARLARNKERELRKRQAVPPWFEKQLVKEIYEKSAELTRETGILHHVDHIIPLRGENVCGLHCLANLQIIPWYQNLTKGNKLTEVVT